MRRCNRCGKDEDHTAPDKEFCMCYPDVAGSWSDAAIEDAEFDATRLYPENPQYIYSDPRRVGFILARLNRSLDEAYTRLERRK